MTTIIKIIATIIYLTFFCIDIIAQISVFPVGVLENTRIMLRTQTGHNGCIKMFHTIV